MEWNRRGFLGASISAAAYPYARVLAKPALLASQLTLSFEDVGGSTNNSGEKNNKAFQKAVNYLDRRGGGTLFIPPKVYPFSGGCAAIARSVMVSGYGATFAGEYITLQTLDGSAGYDFEGLTLVETSGSNQTFLLDCRGSGSHFKDIHLEKNPPALGYIGYCREGTSANLFENLSFSGSNGIFLGGHDHQVVGGWGESAFGDDCWAIKAANSPCYNIRISGFRARRFGALLSIGSEVGSARLDDPTHSLFVRNVVVDNCSADECTYLAYIKPGGVERYDYRDGLVENVAITDCKLTDGTGQHFRDGVFVSPGRGGIVRGLTIQNLTITARAAVPAVQSVAAIYLRPLQTTNGAGEGGLIEDVYISGLQCTDPFGGVANGDQTPGGPIHSLIAIEKADPAVGRVGRVEVADSSVDGCARMAVSLGNNLEGPVRFDRCTFGNFAAAILGSVDKGSVLARSPVELTDIVTSQSPFAPADTRGVMSDAAPDKKVDYSGNVAKVSAPSVSPGASATTFAIQTSDRDTWISRVEVSVAQPIAASQTDFARFKLLNSANGAVLGSATTSRGMLSEPGVSASLNGDINFSGVSACIPKGAQLLLEISQAGAGVSIVEPNFVVHCVPYGLT